MALLGLLGALLAIGASIVAFVLPIAAYIRAGWIKDDVARLRGQLAELELSVEQLRRELQSAHASATERRPATQPVSSTVTEAAPRPADALPEATAVAPEAVAPPVVPRTSADAASPSVEEPLAAAREPADARPPDEAPAPLHEPSAPSTSETPPLSVEPSDVSGPPPSPTLREAPRLPATEAAPAPAEPSAPPPSLEERIALVWFTRIGAIALLLGVAYFFKFAVDNDWIGPLGRVALGAVTGAALLAGGEVAMRRLGTTLWPQVVLGVGLGFLLLSTYASFAFYQLVPLELAFGAFFIVTLLGGALALSHRSQGVLLFSLGAALAAPVLLSTGKDNPLGLFGYLLVVTSLSHAVAVRMEAVTPIYTAIVGCAALFIGWYERYFDASPVPAYSYDDVPAQAGPYFELISRRWPLFGVTGFFVQWLAVYAAARRRPALPKVPVVVAAALLAHVGYAALLYDHPMLLGGLLIALGLAASAVLTAEGRSEWMALPLFASFAVLATVLERADGARPPGMMLLLVGWGGLYIASFLRGKLAEAASGERPLTQGTLWLVGLAGLGLACLAALLTARGHHLQLGLVVVALSLGYAALGAIAGAAILPLVAVVLSSLFMTVSAPRVHDTLDLRNLGLFGAWAATYLGVLAWELGVRRASPTLGRLGTFSLAGLLFLLLVPRVVPFEEHLLRAALVSAIGLVDLLLALRLLRTRGVGGLERPSDLLGAQALALFAYAAVELLSGAAVTVVWILLASVVCWLGLRGRERTWLLGGGALFGAVLLRLYTVDLPLPERLHQLYLATSGEEGTYQQPLLVNGRAAAFGAAAVALLLLGRMVLGSARQLGAGEPAAPLWQRLGSAFTVAGHAALLTLIVFEVHRLAQAWPPPPPAGLPPAEFEQFSERLREVRGLEHQKLFMLTTLVWGVYALGLLGVGFSLRDALTRYLGLALFAVTLVKLGLFDVWRLDKVYQVLVLMGVGALMVGSGFLYARFGRRLLALLRDEGPRILPLLLGGASLLWGGGAEAVERARYAAERPIEGIAAPGLYRLELDAPVYEASKSRLSDLRLVGPDGAEVPCFVREVPTVEQPARRSATLVDPVRGPDGSLSAILDLGQAGLKHDRVTLTVDGSTLLRKSRIEVSTDEKSWALLSEGGVVYRVSTAESDTDSRARTLRYPTSDARYLRVTLLPSSDEATAIRGGEVWFSPPAAEPLLRERQLPLASSSVDEQRHRSRFIFDLGQAGLPISELELVLGAGAPSGFERRAEVTASSHLDYFVPAGAGWLFGSANGRGSLRLSVAAVKRTYRVEIDDGNDRPLPVEAARLRWRAEELVLRASAPGPHTLLVGAEHDAGAHYDLAAVLARGGAPALAEARFGPLGANPAFGQSPVDEASKPLTERYRAALSLVLGLLLAGLALYTVRLLRRA